MRAREPPYPSFSLVLEKSGTLQGKQSAISSVHTQETTVKQGPYPKDREDPLMVSPIDLVRRRVGSDIHGENKLWSSEPR